MPTSCATGVSAGRRCFGWSRKGRPHPPTDLHHGLTSASICVSPVPQGIGGDAVHVALILQTRATAAIRVHCVQRRRQRRAAGGFAAVAFLGEVDALRQELLHRHDVRASMQPASRHDAKPDHRQRQHDGRHGERGKLHEIDDAGGPFGEMDQRPRHGERKQRRPRDRDQAVAAAGARSRSYSGSTLRTILGTYNFAGDLISVESAD
jgi:hypothetical protein